MPIVTLARKMLKLDRAGFTAKEAATADGLWMMAAVLTWLVYMGADRW